LEVEDIIGVVNGEPEAKAEPPVVAAYHLKVEPVGPVAARLTVPVPQRTPFVVVVIFDAKTTCTGVEFVVTGPFAQVTLHLYHVGAIGAITRLEEIPPDISV
jgi:hypothetical protein